MKITKILLQPTRFGTGILCFIMSCILGTTATAQSNYYWSNKTKIDVKEDRSSVIFQFKKNTAVQAYFDKPMAAVEGVEIHNFQHRAIVKFNSAQANTPQNIAKELGIDVSNLESATFGLVLNDGFNIWPTHKIVLALRKDATISALSTILDKYEATIEKTKYNRITLHVNDITKVLPLANQLYNDAKVTWAHPDFYAKVEHNFTPTDTYYSNQFQMNNSNDVDCDAPEAWDITRGASSLRVAVIDDGLEAHEDLPNINTSLGYTPANNGNGTPIANGKHGVSCAGSIGAAHNGIGVAGIAPNVELFSVNIFYGGETGSNLADAISYSKNQGADVMSNSWGYSSCTFTVDVLNTALADAKNTGRNGKGCVIVFAAGNDYATCVSYPGNNPNVIGVGAITNTGVRSSYSNQGNKLDVSAPSSGGPTQGTLGVYTTDRMGSAGYASGNYTGNFGGTSSACPLVSGVAALVLSANANLTSAQVQTILETTADDMGANGFDVQFGHGRVNAHQAVLAANGGGGGTPTPSCVGTNVTLTLVTDNYGSETTWSLTNNSGAVVHSGSGYGNNQTYTFNWTLADDSYSFTINDSYGDGICCPYGNGSYNLVEGTTSIKSGGSFTSTETTTFCVSGNGSSGGSACPTIDLSATTINAYGNGQDQGSSTVNAAGELSISNNAWKSISDNYTVTANTVIEFDFKSSSQGEIHGIGFDNDDNISSNRTFRLYGSQNWGLANYNNYASSAGAWKSYTIPVGQLYTGTFDRLFFVCDDDASNGGNASFRNIKIYEGSCPSSSASINLFADVTAIHGVENEAAVMNVNLYPNPAQSQLTLELDDLEVGTEVSIIDATGRLVWSSPLTDTESNIDINRFTAGMYNLTIRKPNGAFITKHFVKL